MMMTLISIGIAFIALAAGMFLLAKTVKEALPVFYKIMSWFIIASSFLIMVCASVHCMMSFYGKHFRYDMMMRHKSQEKWDKTNGHRGHMHHHKKRNKYFDGNLNYYHGSDYCCEGNHQQRYWKKVFNDSCIRKEHRQNK